MRWTRQFIPTLKEDPQEAEIASHKLMLRAGLIRRLSAGLYTFLPLGWRALRKVEGIVREEMDRAGALEVLMPALHPKEIWERTGRYEVLREVMFSMVDRQDRALVLGPTHEEIITELVGREIRSYRDLPKNFYQIQSKFRDEIRPRFGLMRAKEFIMKDAYSFDPDEEATEASYQAMYAAYRAIFARCGLDTQVVEAETGAMGGQFSHEFMVLAEAGEDGLVECSSCDYAANLERAEGVARHETAFPSREGSLEEVSTPGMHSVREVAAFLDVEPRSLIKTLIYWADDRPVAVLVPGDRDVNEVKLARVLGAVALNLADDAQIEEVTGAPVGFAGPVGLECPIYADAKLKGYSGAVTGANKADAHYVHVDLERDAKVTAFHDLSYAMDGDGCPRCGGVLAERRGIEVGHVFKLGTKYSEVLGATFLDAQGRQRPAIMGCYGIGVTRTLQAVIEQSHDENGIIWPISIAPYPVEVLVLNTQHPESLQAADRLVRELSEAGLEVLYDDRDERPGVKFKDADLLGLPIRVAIGERSLGRGEVELKLRREGEVQRVAMDEASARVEALRQALVEELQPVPDGG